MMVDVFLLIGVVLPLLLSRLFYDERIVWVQWIGILLLVLAGYIMCTYNASINGKMPRSAYFLLALCALSNGVTDFSQKMFTRELPTGSIAIFNLYTYLFTGVILGVLCLLFRRKEKKTVALQPPKAVILPILGYIVIMAICLFLYSYFKTRAAHYLTAAEIYPLSQGGAVILSTAMAAVFFKEKITPRCIIGMVLAFAAIILLK
jgi:drug/metabolite transporter (DMT)-like permease